MKHIDTDGIDPIVEPVEDKIHRVVRTVISGLPGLGGPGTEMFNALVAPPLEKRKLKWALEISEAINSLIDQGRETAERLQENERFISLLMHTSQIAIRTHNEMKFEALRNATINAIGENILEESLMHIFINLVDIFTPLHLLVLRYIDEHDITFAGNMDPTDLCRALQIVEPLKGMIDVDLKSKGLIELVELKDEAPGYMKAWKLTSMGKDFLDFIGERN